MVDTTDLRGAVGGGGGGGVGSCSAFASCRLSLLRPACGVPAAPGVTVMDAWLLSPTCHHEQWDTGSCDATGCYQGFDG